MDQIERDIYVLQSLAEGVEVVEISFHDIDVLRPVEAFKAGSIPGHGAYAESCFEEFWDDTSANVAGSAGHQNLALRVMCGDMESGATVHSTSIELEVCRTSASALLPRLLTFTPNS